MRIVFHGANSSSYTALLVKVINRTMGVVDTICLDFKAILGNKLVDNQTFEDGVAPHISVDRYKTPSVPEWFVYEPVESDYEALAKALTDYLSVFADDSYKKEV